MQKENSECTVAHSRSACDVFSCQGCI